MGRATITVPAGLLRDDADNLNLLATHTVLVGEDSQAPTGVALTAASDTGTTGDNTTNKSKPAFTVEGTVAGSTVKVTATKADGSTSVTGTATGTATDTMVDFTQSICGSAGNQACTALTGGNWVISASHQESGKIEEPLAEARRLTITVDLIPPPVPVITITPAGAAARSRSIAATGASKYKVQADSVACAAAPPSDALDYTPGTTTLSYNTEAANANKVCFWETDSAGNHRTTFADITGIDRTDPAIEITTNAASSTIDDSSTVRVTFTVTDVNSVTFEHADIAFTKPSGSNASLSALSPVSGSTNTWTATLNAGTTAGDLTISVPAGRFQDAAGNNNTVSTTATAGVSTVTLTVRLRTPSAVPGLLFPSTVTNDRGDIIPNDTGVNMTDLLTSAPTPVFRVTGVVAGATVAVEGQRYNGNSPRTGRTDRIARSATVPADADDIDTYMDGDGNTIRYVDIPLPEAQRVCDDGDPDTTEDDSCDLANGTWWFRAAQTESGKSIARSAVGTVKLRIDQNDFVSMNYYRANRITFRPDRTGQAGSRKEKSLEISTFKHVGGGVFEPMSFVLLLHGNTDTTTCPTAISDYTSVAGNAMINVRTQDPIIYTGPSYITHTGSTYQARFIYTFNQEAHNGKLVCAIAFDEAGNIGRLSPNNPARITGIDRTAPSFSNPGSSITLDHDPVIVGKTATLTFTSAERLLGFEFGDISNGDSTKATLAAATAFPRDGTVFTVTVTGVAAGATTITIPVNKYTDRAGWNNVQNTFTINVAEPTPSATPTLAYAGAAVTTEDEPSFTVGNVQLNATVRVEATNTATNPATVVSKRMADIDPVPPGAETTIQFTDTATDCDTDGNGTYTESCELVDGAWTFRAYQAEDDYAKSETVAATTQNITIDTAAPTVTITMDPPTINVDSSSVVTFTLSEPIDNFVESFTFADVTPPDSGIAMLTELSFPTTGKVFTATLTGVSVGDAVISVAAGQFSDVASQLNPAPDAGAGTGTFTVAVGAELTTPTVALKDAASDTGSSDADGITRNNTPTFTVANMTTGATKVTVTATQGARAVSRALAGLTGTGASVDVAFTDATDCTIVTTDDNGDATTAEGQSCELADGVWAVTAVYVGNGLDSAVATASVTIDTIAPTIAVTLADDPAKPNDHDLALNDTATVVFNVEANVVGFAFADDVTHNASGDLVAAANFPDNGSYQATFTGSTAGTYTISVPANSFTDVAGNQNIASNTARIGVGQTDVSAAPVITGPRFNSAVGRTFTLAGTAAPNAEVDITSGVAGVSVTADSAGNWTADLNVSGLADRAFTVLVRATEDGKDPSPPADLALARQATKPAVSIAWDAASYTETPASGESATATLTVTSSEPAPTGGLTVRVAVSVPAQFFPGVTPRTELTIAAGETEATWTADWDDESAGTSYLHEADGVLSAEVLAVASDPYALGVGHLARSPFADDDDGVYFVASIADDSGNEDAVTPADRKVEFIIKKLFANASVSDTPLEAAPTGDVTDTRTTGTAETWSVAYSFIDGTASSAAGTDQDYTATPGTLVFGPSETEKTITATIIGDDDPERPETFMLRLANPTAGQTHGDTPNFRRDLGGADGYEPASGSGDPLNITATIAESDGGLQSATPTVAMTSIGTTSDDGATAYTNDTTPAFKITGVAASSTVTVSATKGNTKLSLPEITVGATVPVDGVPDEFSGNDCAKVVTAQNGDKTRTTGELCNLDEGIWTITVSHVEDGNDPGVATLTLNVDLTPPTITAITAAATEIGLNATTEVTITTSESVAGFEVGEIEAIPGSLTTLTNPNFPTSGSTYTATFTPAAELRALGRYRVSVPAGQFTDLAGNQNTAADQSVEAAITVTLPKPTLSLHTDFDSGVKGDNTTSNVTPFLPIDNLPGITTVYAQVTVTATEATSKATVSQQPSATNRARTAASFHGNICSTSADPRDSDREDCALSEGEWSITVSYTVPDATPPATIASPVSDTLTLVIDRTAPTVESISVSAPAINSAGTAVVTFDFDEPIDPDTFTTSDLGTLSHTRVTAGPTPDENDNTVYTITVEGTSAGYDSFRLDVGAFTDAAGNLSAAASSTREAAPSVGVRHSDGSLPSRPPVLTLTSGGTSTKDNMPAFTVAGVVASATVTVSATKDNTKLTKPAVTVAPSDAGSVSVTFSNSDCTKATIAQDGTETPMPGLQSCTLADGPWVITASHKEGTATAATDSLTVTIDTAAPTITDISAAADFGGSGSRCRG